MSKEAVLAFVNATENDPELKAHLQSVKGSDAVIGFAAQHGFEFTADEFQPVMQVLRFMHDVIRDNTIRAGVGQAGDDDAVVAFAQERGYEFAVEDLAYVRFVPAEGGALSDQELEAVAGGAVGDLTASSDLRVQLDASRSKTSSGQSFSEVAASGLSKTADVALSAGQLAAPYIPGGSVLSAALSG